MKVFLSVMMLVLPALLYADLCGTPTDASMSLLRSDLYRGQQEFSVAMLDAIRKATPNENVFFSPYSTYHALLLAYFGATGESEQELANALRLKWAQNKEAVRSAYRSEKKLREVRNKEMPLEFASADRLYFDETVKLAECLDSRLHDEIVQLNIMQNVEQSRLQINAWIANVTHDQIKDMIVSGDIDSRTQLVLANAAYFKGQWSNRFNADKTQQMPFYTSSEKFSFVPMMKQKGNFLLHPDERLGAHVLQLPYKTSMKDDDENSDISMVIILPAFNNDALEQVLSKLNADTLDASLKEASMREIEVSLPKFEFEQRLELLPILRQMGVNQIFDSNASFNDFSTVQKLSFGDAKHMAKIKVDEEGSTAAAATVLVSFRSARPVEPTKFECNHPFVFLIYDHKASAVLFTGIYRDPKTMK
ncbi:serine protease inhibitor 88Ea [Drosophila hydei]|uniref:Serine protease inhibitor 88Ea n=1 Tax=Drosophila hydei TaxID=7224 RepID=A0A6J2SNI6_DROHY|nr:serine protease inhibitor 88Ea [Drosophila hydei]XP_030078641.1 serine protease inhibitor 88Ea [Drosophila hydei]XP_030078642.1 serine protease inhibitor 88Ea [Drosophila hydei]XP_030078643.1 serine protease inhibitor 88Ea [Drosophila hydei]